MRKSEKKRTTKETDVFVSLNLDGTGEYKIDSSIGFLDHMLTLFAVHSDIDLECKCIGDNYVDDHHGTEDIAIVLAECFKEALGDKRGIKRYSSILLPMDEALVSVALDISNRGYLSFCVDFPTEKIGTFDSQNIEEFFASFCRYSSITLHIDLIRGKNSHHIAEAIFKAFARAIKEAISIDDKKKNIIPSSKGEL